MRRSKPTPARRYDPRVDELLTTIRIAHHPVDVIAATLELRDRTANPVRVGGGLFGARARLHAEDIIEALDGRGMLARQGVLL
jgi:hypothetical protein